MLKDAQNYAKKLNFEVPLDMGSQSNCQMGGVFATNAGGLKFVK